MTKALAISTGHHPSKHVLLLLANYADENDECFPSIDRIVSESELAPRTVRKCLENLEALGLLEREQARKADGTMARSRFRLMLSQHSANLRKVDSEDADDASDRRYVVPTDEPDRRHHVPTDRRHVVPQPAARGATGHIRINPPLEPVEREARASAAVAEHIKRSDAPSDPRADAAFMRFMDRWPTGKTDDLDRAFSSWSRLSDDDRKAALEGIDPFRIANRADGRSVICASSTYLKNRSWERLSSPASGSGTGALSSMVGAFSRTWWVILHRRRDRGEPLRLMLSQASEGRGFAVRRADLPTEAEELALARLDRNGEAFAEWRAALAAEGVHLPDITVPFVWMPTEWPPARATDDEADMAAEFDGAWSVSR